MKRPFVHIVTTLPLLEAKVEGFDSTSMVKLKEGFTSVTERPFPEDFDIYVFHIDEILRCQGMNEGEKIEIFFKNDLPFPIDFLCSIIQIGRARKRFAVLQIRDESELSLIRDKRLKFCIQHETVFVA